jgi:hypothetical protein
MRGNSRQTQCFGLDGYAVLEVGRAPFGDEVSSVHGSR